MSSGWRSLSREIGVQLLDRSPGHGSDQRRRLERGSVLPYVRDMIAVPRLLHYRQQLLDCDHSHALIVSYAQ